MFIFGVDRVEYLLRNDDEDDLVSIAEVLVYGQGWNSDMKVFIFEDCFAVTLWKSV